MIYSKSILILYPIYYLGLPSDLFLEDYPSKSYMHVSSLPYIPLAPPRVVVLDLRAITIIIIIIIIIIMLTLQ
jgi:hypothetical protein